MPTTGITQKRKASELTKEERTPKLEKFQDTDVVVVVGGVEFYHYKLLLSGIPFFARAFSHNWKENKESRVEIQETECSPDDWLEVYDLMQGTKTEENVLETLVVKDSGLGAPVRLLTCFDFLGMEQTVLDYDKCASKFAKKKFTKEDEYPTYEDWAQIKGKPCPKLKRTVLRLCKRKVVKEVTNQETGDAEEFLKDDCCGVDMWTYLLDGVEFEDYDLDCVVKPATGLQIANCAPMLPYVLGKIGETLSSQRSRNAAGERSGFGPRFRDHEEWGGFSDSDSDSSLYSNTSSG